jgi:hypothetical protein
MNFIKGGFRGLAVLGLTVLALAFPAAAGAQGQQDCAGPTGDQYCPPIQLTASGSGEDPGDPGDPGTGSSSGGLPFTGLDLALSLAAGAGLLGAGLVLRRASRSSDAAG